MSTIYISAFPQERGFEVKRIFLPISRICHYEITKDGTTLPAIQNVIFNPPATIVFWADGTKTVVQARGEDEFDPEKGLAMAISKKALGNQGNYFDEIKKWVEPYRQEESEIRTKVDDIVKNIREGMVKFNTMYLGKKESNTNVDI